MIFVNTGYNGTKFKSGYIRPFSCCERFPIPRISHIASRITVLFKPVFPSHVPWFIISIIVNSPDTAFSAVVRCRTNIIVKCLKRLAPRFCYRNSPAAIIIPMWPIVVVTSGDHVDPCSPFFSTRHPMFSWDSILFETSTAFCKSVCKFGNSKGMNTSTFAPAKTPSFLCRYITWTMDIFDKCQSTFNWLYGWA